jgi:hypothetical protein
MQELLNSMVRLSAAMTVFGMQQVETAVGSVDATESMNKLREVIDAMAAAVSSKIDESKRPTLDSVSNLGHDVVGRTMSSMNAIKVPSINPREIVQNTSEMVSKTSDWLDKMVKPSPATTSEPKPAEEALAAH